MNAISTRHTWIGGLLVALSLISFTGCQLLGKQQQQVNDSVVVGSASADFGRVAVGSKKTIQNTLTNFKPSSVTIVSIAGLDSNFQITGITLPLILAPGQEVGFAVEFQPAGTGPVSNTVQFGDNSEFVASMDASGEGVEAGQLVLNPTSVNFGNIKVGSNQTSNVTLSNGGTTDLTINQATLSGAGFAMSNLALPLTLHAGNSTSLTVTFAPTGIGNFSGSLSFTTASADQAQAQTKKFGKAQAQQDDTTVLPLSGTGISSGVLSANPTSIAFGNVQFGSSSNKSETLTNTGSSAVTISQANLTGSGFFVTGLSLPVTVNPNQGVTFTVKFTPTGGGAVSGNLAIISDANSPLNIPLSGAGLTQGQITPNPTSLSFGTVVIGNSKTLPETLTNSGGSSVTISAASASGSGFSITGLTLPLTLTAGQSTTFNVKFTPAAAGASNGNVTITSDGSNPTLNVAISGTGATAGALSANPTSIPFGSVQVGSSSTQSETLTNTGGSTVNISQANVTGAGFTISGLSLPATLTPNQSVTFNVRFAPSSPGSVTGNIAVVSDAPGSPLNIGLTGDGLAAGSLSASPSSVNFGNVMIGNSKTVPVTVTNNGGVDVTITNAATTGTGFSFTGPTLPVTVSAGQSTVFNAIFTPTSSGNSSGTLTITSNANNSTLNVPLTGKGITQGQIDPNPTSQSFGNVVIGSSKNLTQTLTNSGGSSVTISAASATGAGFSLSGLTLPLTLPAGQSTTFTVQFAPTVAGAASGTVTITSNGANPTLNVPVSGTGVTPGTLSATSTSLAFGNVQVGSSSSLPETLTNTGGANVTISQANLTGTGYSVTGLTLPVTLTPNQAVTFSVKFAPTVAGAANGNLAIVSDASNSPLNIGLSGTGVAPGQITPNPTSLSFGNVQVGNSKTLPETLTNSGGSTVTISAASVTGSGMSFTGLTLPVTLTAGQSTSFSVQFAPTAGGVVSGNLKISSDGSNPTLNIALSGTGTTPGTLSPNPSSLAFGNVQVGNSVNLPETLTNTGGTTVNISQVNVTGAGFSITGLTLPATLTANQSVTFTATFLPTGTGSASGTLAIISDAANSPLNIGLSGTGTAQGQLSVSPLTLDFGNVTVGSGSALPGTLNAIGASVTVSGASSSSGEFVLSGITFPKTIAAGASASFTVTFTPTATGTASASLTFASNASNSPTIEALTGNGQAPPSHSVDLSWNASQSQDVTGYNIYRRIPSGSYGSPLNGSLNPDLNYTDSTVAAGSTYFYVARAVDSNGVESGNSNEVQAVIPTP